MKTKMISMIAALAAFAAFGVTPNTEFHDIPGTYKLGEVLSAGGAVTSETDPTVPAWAKEATPPTTMTTNAVRDIANATIATNALTVTVTNRVAALETAKADKVALTAHTTNTNNPHKVTAEQIGAVPLVEDKNGNKTAVTIGSRESDSTIGNNSLAQGNSVKATGFSTHAEGYYSHADGDYTHAEGSYTYTGGYGTHAEGYGSHADGDYTHAEGDYTHASGFSTHAEGDFTHADGYFSHAEGSHTHAGTFASKAAGINSEATNRTAFVWQGTDIGNDSHIDHNAVPPYGSHGPGTFNINPAGGLDGFYIGEQTLAGILLSSVTNNISATNPTFSNAVLAVGLNIDTNSVAVLNELAATFGDFPITGTATTVGALLAALAAAAAWLKKNKVQTLKLEDGSVETSADGGVAKLDDFFTESNSLLTGTIAANSARLALDEDGEIIVTMNTED